jgi:hypothetical protein
VPTKVDLDRQAAMIEDLSTEDVDPLPLSTTESDHMSEFPGSGQLLAGPRWTGSCWLTMITHGVDRLSYAKKLVTA